MTTRSDQGTGRRVLCRDIFKRYRLAAEVEAVAELIEIDVEIDVDPVTPVYVDPPDERVDDHLLRFDVRQLIKLRPADQHLILFSQRIHDGLPFRTGGCRVLVAELFYR